MKNNENVETVDKSKHAKLRVKLNPDLAHAKELNLVAITLGELSACTCNFPIVFIQNPNSKNFFPIAMFGLRAGENVYYGKDGWESSYMPMLVQREPFLIGFDDRKEDSTDVTTCLDMKSPYLSEVEGIAMFTPDGEETDYLKSRHQMLAAIFEGEKVTARYCAKLAELNLLSPLELVIQPQDGELRRITGIYSIDERKLKELTPEQVNELHSLDYLPACYIMLGSVFQLNKLIRLRNEKGGEQIVNFKIEIGQPAAEPVAANS